MAFNFNGAAQVPLSVFGGAVSEMAPPDLPEGVSPGCNDVVFVPGSVASRPALQKVFATPFPTTFPLPVPTITWAKSFVMPNGDIENMYLDSNGLLYMEDLTNNPGIYTHIGTVTNESWALSTTAFGREYIGFSDSRHGTDVPLQWDGTNLDRVTQDGPGVAPVVSSVALPEVDMVATSSTPVTITITECDQAGGGGQINVFTSSSVAALNVGSLLTISSNAQAAFNQADLPIVAIYPGSGSSLVVVSAFTPPGTPFGLGGTGTATVSITASRAANIVTVKTSAAHNLRVGYQVLIAGLPASPIAGGTSPIIDSITIDNEDLPGLATIVTTDPHGLIPNLLVSIAGVTGVVVGTGIATVARAGGVVTVVLSAAAALTPGSIITLAGVSDASFNTSVPILSVVAPDTFTFAQTDTDGTSSGGTVSLNWPIPESETPTYFQVVSAPTATSFQIQLAYSDGVWSGGSVSSATITFGWNGTFYVTAVPSTTILQYQQYGPNASSSTDGTVTPWGQAAPGIHQCQVMFLTRQGYVTRPSPPTQFIANGGQYVSVGSIPIGPSNVVARILAFTGAAGAFFYYIPSAAEVNNQIVSTATQVNDNTTTQVLLDFSDNTLFAALGTSIPGNDVAAQIVLDGALGFGFYADRLITWGQRNRIQSLINMGFDGGYLSSAATLPAGWNASANVGGALAAGHFGEGWHITAAGSGTHYGSISQPAFEDAYGAPILTPNTQYRFRAWILPSVNSNQVTLSARISSASASFSTVAAIDTTGIFPNGSFKDVLFDKVMPAAIPSDMILTIYAASISGGAYSMLIDELSIIYDEEPYLDTIMYGSYVENPEAFDGVTGKFGPSQDTHQVMANGVIRQTLYMLTLDPSGRLHETIDNGVTEPSGWTINEVAANCGALGAFALTRSQADDSSASGGEEWLAWASSSGPRIFSGDQPWKVGQEIQPDWVGAAAAGATAWSTAQGINPAYNTLAWALNDPVSRRIYFGLPLTAAVQGTPNIVWVLDYRELDTAYQIGTSPPIHTSFTGKLIATDHVRKWAPWNMTMNGAALMYRAPGVLSPVFFGGNGVALGLLSGFGNVYTLNPAMMTDDDYGQINPAYTTYFFVTHDQEAQLSVQSGGQRIPLGGGRKMVAYFTAFIAGTGQITITPLCDSVANPWALVGVRSLSAAPTFDLEWAGGNAQGQRIAFQFASQPVGEDVTDNGFNLQKIVVALKIPRLPVRGSST